MALPPGSISDRDLAEALALLDQLQPALDRHDRATQNAIVDRLLALRAPMGEQWRDLAYLALGNGEIGAARAAIDRFVEATGGTPAAQYQKVMLLEQAGDVRASYHLLRSLPADQPDPVINAYSRGTAALFVGEIAEARAQLERAVHLQPHFGTAWLSLATTADLARDADLADRIVAAESEMDRATSPHRAAYYYALGKAHADRGEHAAAFAAFATGARELGSLVRYSRDSDRRNANESLDGYDRPAVTGLGRRQPKPTDRAIFVVGLPRTGTTLLEQVLTRHSEVGGGGEINRLALLANEVGGHSFGQLERHADTAGVAEAGRLWRHWLDQRFPGPGRVVDKSMINSRLVGVASALLPDAPLIWLTRDPLDCAWSCFRTFFQGHMPWSHDLEDIAFHFAIEDELRARWQDILGDRLLVIAYETLVSEPESAIRGILTHCGLAEEPQVFAPHESDRAVTTASVMQVRRPINHQGIGAADPYRPFLAPFIESYYR